MIINDKKFSIIRYSSGELKLKHEMLKSYIENNVANILYDGEGLSLFELFILCKYFISEGIKTNLTLAYLPYQRMDHNNGIEVETVKIVADLFNELKLDSLKICEPHCDLSYFDNAQKINLVDKIYKKVIKQIGFDESKDVVVFTDKGSYQKFNSLGKNRLFASKERDIKTGLISSYNLSGEINPEQKIIIVDDIISSGDTLIETLKEIKKRTSTKVDIICGHFENNLYNTRLFELKQVNHIYASNSLVKSGNDKLILFNVEGLVNG